MKFMVMVCAAFLARVNPVSTIAKPACMNITRNPATNVHTKLIATVFAAEAALAALARESAAGTPCPASATGHARVISSPRPTERLIRSPSEGSHDALMSLISCKNCTYCLALRYYPIGWCALMSQESCIFYMFHDTVAYRGGSVYRRAPLRLTRSAACGQLSRSSTVCDMNLRSGVSCPRPHGGRPQPAGRQRACTSPR
jgi:hypothetical protein